MNPAQKKENFDLVPHPVILYMAEYLDVLSLLRCFPVCKMFSTLLRQDRRNVQLQAILDKYRSFGPWLRQFLVKDLNEGLMTVAYSELLSSVEFQLDTLYSLIESPLQTMRPTIDSYLEPATLAKLTGAVETVLKGPLPIEFSPNGSDSSTCVLVEIENKRNDYGILRCNYVVYNILPSLGGRVRIEKKRCRSLTEATRHFESDDEKDRKLPFKKMKLNHIKTLDGRDISIGQVLPWQVRVKPLPVMGIARYQ